MHRCIPLLLLASLLCWEQALLAEEFPKVLDDRLKLELIAEAPVVRTPTGIAIDDKGRVYVIESHTHFRPNNYEGPQHDRILRFEKKPDPAGEENKEKYEPSVFFEGTTHTMGCGFHPDGSLYVATRMEIFKLNDKNNNGKIEADERTNLVKHETAGNYPHNGLSGFAFDIAGNVYFGQGENLGADYKVIGSDGTSISGGGEGGNIYCIKADGSKLRRVATGFWNPFHLYIDPFGRLFTVDNDPDSRPPCRLLHVVEGGDYGYRFRNGRKGTHPFTSWFGELPGTLPMVSGTGEAPSGIVGGFEVIPKEIASRDLLVTSWGDHRIERYAPQTSGASFKSEMVPLVTGGENFRPVGIAIHPDGSYWFSDWVDKSYQLHSKGRLWRIVTPRKKKPGIVSCGFTTRLNPPEAVRRDSIIEVIYSPRNPPEYIAEMLGGYLNKPTVLPNGIDFLPLTKPDKPGEVRYAATRRLDPKNEQQRERLLELVGDPDPFIQQAARWALKPAAEELADFEFAKEKRPATRLGIALVLAEANRPAGKKRIPELLNDTDPLVRFVAIKWIGEERLKEVWAAVKEDLEKQLATRQELEAFLATSAFLAEDKYDPGKESPGEEFVAKMLLDKNTSPQRQAFLLRMLRADHPAITAELLQKWIEGENPAVRLAALQKISQHAAPPGFLNLATFSQEKNRPIAERLETIGAMASDPPKYEAILQELLNDKEPLIAAQAGRTIRTNQDLATKASIAFGPEGRNLATDLAGWKSVLEKQPGDPKSGEFIFHHSLAKCSRCHEVQGRGAAIGPNLTGIGKSMSRERLIASLFQPSQEIAPQFAVWQLETNEGKILKGMYLGEEVDGTVIYADEQGGKFKLHPRDLAERTQQKTSLMPEGLPYSLTDQELRDLLAYLAQ